MGLPALLLEEIESFAREATSAPPSLVEKARAAKERWLASAEELAESARQLRERNLAIRKILAAFLDTPASQGAELDEIIDVLRTAELQIKEAKPSIERLKSTRKGTFSMRGATPGEKARALAIVDRYITIVNESAETLRDLRWQAMARRASLEEHGDAPVFDDPKELLKYLKSHSG
jgi:hypothetical protein